MKTYNWEGFCTENRLSGIGSIETSVNRLGYILDFHRFSDLSLSLTIGIEENKSGILFDELAKTMEISGNKPEETDSKTECMIYLNVSFSKGTGDLRTEVPEVPG